MDFPIHGTTSPAVWSLRTDDTGEFTEKIRPVACALSVQTEPRNGFHGELDAVRLSQMSLFTVGFSHTRVTDPNRRPFLSLTIPLSGSARIRVGQRVQEFTPGSAHLLLQDETLDYQIGEHPCHSLVLNFDQAFVDAYLSQKGRDPLSPSDHFTPIDKRSPRGRSLLRLAHFAWGEAARGTYLDPSTLGSREMENALLASTLDAIAPEAPADRCQPGHIRRATDYLMDHLAEPVSLAQVAAIAGVSERSLRRDFQKSFGLTVSQFLTRRRLEAVHRVLQSATPFETTVTETATRFGFSHLGRFSAAYRSAFGCSPSESLRS